jgi:predicted transcriptional regulator
MSWKWQFEAEIVMFFEQYAQLVKLWMNFLLHNGLMKKFHNKWTVTEKGVNIQIKYVK